MSYNIIWGLALNGDAEQIPEEFERYLYAQGIESKYVCRTSFETIKQYLTTCKKGENTTLIVSYIYTIDDKDRVVTLAELEAYRKLVPDVNIIIVIPDEEFGKNSLHQLLKNGYFNGIASGDTETMPELCRNLSRVVLGQRSYADARAYYRIQETPEGKADTSTTFETVDAGFSFMTRPLASGETYAERLVLLKDRAVSPNVYYEVIESLDENIKQEIRVSPDFDALFAGDFDAVQSGRVVDDGERHRQRKQQKGLGTVNRTEETVERHVLAQTSSIRGAVRKVPIGIASVCERLGSTHQAILVAKFLADNGYDRIAVIEDSRQKHKSFDEMAANFGYELRNGMYSAEGIDFYPDFPVDEINSLNPMGYDFYIFDFGLLDEVNLEDFNACTTQMLLCGSQAWNFNEISRVFDMVPYDKQLNMYDYVFMSAPKRDMANIRRKMAGLEKIRFAKYYPEPFSSVEPDDMLYLVLKGFLGSVEKKVPFTKKIKKFFE